MFTSFISRRVRRISSTTFICSSVAFAYTNPSLNRLWADNQRASNVSSDKSGHSAAADASLQVGNDSRYPDRQSSRSRGSTASPALTFSIRRRYASVRRPPSRADVHF